MPLWWPLWQQPLWLLGLLIPLLLALLWRRGSGWSRWIDPSLLSGLLERSPAALVPGLAGCAALMVAAIALAQPYWNTGEEISLNRRDTLALILDLSPTMSLQDIAPSRLQRARLKIHDALNAHQGEAMLLVWGAAPHLVIPPTADTNTITHQLEVLEPGLMPAPGNAPAAAVALATEILQRQGRQVAQLLLLSDGAPEAQLDALEMAVRTSPYPVSVLGIGSAQVGPILDSKGHFQHDAVGNPLIGSSDPAQMRAPVESAGGHYQAFTPDDSDLNALLPSVQALTIGSNKILVRQPLGPWLVLLLLLLAPIALARGHWPGLMLGLVLLLPPPGAAESWWYNDNQNALELLQQSHPGEAAELFTDPHWRAIAQFRNGDYAAAVASLRGLPSARAHYNRGSTLAHQGLLQEAISAYATALTLDPDMQDATFNKALLEALLAAQQQAANDGSGQDESNPDERNQQQAQQQQAQQQQAGQPDDERAEQNAEQQHAQQADKDKPNGDDEQSQQRAEGAPDNDDEQTQAFNAIWQQRVEPDPGGLLRRRFEAQNQQQNGR